ncbi:MAG: DNA mismatch repair endonuclease MutL, partial [Candidatus Binatia bacterium]
MAKIQVLPDAVARRIAAGEVIERPVSVVKELVENSIDAGADEVIVELELGGRQRIAVTDNGEGIGREDVSAAFRPHATSKIRSEEDLLRITTLGFRGEALPSIAAVSDVELWTCRRGDGLGTRHRNRGGEMLELEDVGSALGCRIEVRDLFFATPARRKFLKAPATETSQVSQLLGRLALAHTDVGFRLSLDGREAFSLARGDPRERLRRVLGREVEAALRPVVGQGPVGVTGFATHPHFTAASARSILFFVNGRVVRDRVLQHALLAAYATLVPRGRYPAAVLFLRVDPEDLDVNVHPAKLEVRFRDSRAVHDAIAAALRKTLRAGSPAVQSAPAFADAEAAVAETVAEYSET